MSLCVCGSNIKSEDCCVPLHAGKPAPTALALMRARYAAYATKNIDYVEKTCTEKLRKEFNRLDAERYADEAEWIGLEILRTVDGGMDDETGQVEFMTHYKYQNQTLRQHELASFCRINGEWVYCDYEINPKKMPVVNSHQVGRNDPCPCGSQKKYKKCCG
ncbi:MAG: YchJ family metal-binding protein [Bdellovibrionales bacterium]